MNRRNNLKRRQKTRYKRNTLKRRQKTRYKRNTLKRRQKTRRRRNRKGGGKKSRRKNFLREGRKSREDFKIVLPGEDEGQAAALAETQPYSRSGIIKRKKLERASALQKRTDFVAEIKKEEEEEEEERERERRKKEISEQFLSLLKAESAANKVVDELVALRPLSSEEWYQKHSLLASNLLTELAALRQELEASTGVVSEGTLAAEEKAREAL